VEISFFCADTAKIPLKKFPLDDHWISSNGNVPLSAVDDQSAGRFSLCEIAAWTSIKKAQLAIVSLAHMSVKADFTGIWLPTVNFNYFAADEAQKLRRRTIQFWKSARAARYQRDNCFTSHNAAAASPPSRRWINFLPYNKSPGQNIRRSIITFPWVSLFIPFLLCV